MDSVSLADDYHSAFSSSSQLLDPPSYADLVFTPTNHHRLPLSAAYTRICISDPQIESDPAAYVTYLVSSLSPTGAEHRIRRRFREVVALADRLAEPYRGYFVPFRPDKAVVDSQLMQKQEFVEQRRAAIERYLRRLAAHPVIGRSDELRAFLESKGTPIPTATVDAGPRQLLGSETVSPREPAKVGRDLLRMFKELKQTVTNDWVGVKPLAVEEDREFLDRKEKMQDLEVQLAAASQQAESLVKAQHDFGETMGELGLAFIKLTKFETEEAICSSQQIRAADARAVATAAVKASRFYRESNAQTVKHLGALHEYLGLMLSVQGAFSDRSNALLTVQTLLSELASLQSRVEKLEVASSKIFGGDSSRLSKMEELKQTIRITEEAKNVALGKYECIKRNNRSELERVDKEMHDDFLDMLKGFVINQVGYAEKISSVWEELTDEFSKYAIQEE